MDDEERPLRRSSFVFIRIRKRTGLTQSQQSKQSFLVPVPHPASAITLVPMLPSVDSVDSV